jgi:MFS family permease
LAGSAVAFTSFYLAAGALMPLLVTYRDQWGFTAAVLTSAFAVFALGFLAAVLTVGSLSDRVGRRPVLIGALIAQLASNLVFLVAPDVGWVIAARIIGGFATGAATPAFTAALVELSPASRKGLGTTIGSVGLTGGLSAGSLLAGAAIQLTTHANTIVFASLAGLTVLGIGVIAMSPETITRVRGAQRAHGPRVAVPLNARPEFMAALPALAAIWMISALSGGVAPSLVRSVFGIDSGLLNGLSGSVAPATSTLVGLAMVRVNPRYAMIAGIHASVLGVVCMVGGVSAGSLATMILGQAITGAGFGASFTAALRLIIPLTEAHQRAAVVASIYLVSYSAFGLPVVLAGQAADMYGPVPTMFWFGASAVVLAVLGLNARHRLKRGDPRTFSLPRRTVN